MYICHYQDKRLYIERNEVWGNISREKRRKYIGETKSVSQPPPLYKWLHIIDSSLKKVWAQFKTEAVHPTDNNMFDTVWDKCRNATSHNNL